MQLAKVLFKPITSIVLFIALALCIQSAHAGFLDDVTSAVSTAKQVKSSVDQASKHLSSNDNAALPGGVTSRLKKINQELDKAEKSLSKGAGSPQDRAKRAQGYLKRANSYRQEIDKRYKGQFSTENQQITATDQRLVQVDDQINAVLSGQAVAAPAASQDNQAAMGDDQDKMPSGAKYRLDKLDKELANIDRVLAKTSLSTDWRAKQSAMHLEAAQGYLDQIAGSYPQAMASGEIKQAQQNIEQARQKVDSLANQVAGEQTKQAEAEADAKASEDLSRQWVEKLKPFVTSNSGKSLATYPTEDANLWKGWETIHAELAPLWQQYQQTDFSGGKSGELQSVDQRLSRYMANYDTNHAAYAKQAAKAKADMGRIIFSQEPINPASPAGLSTSFQTGDHIYALIQVSKSWSQIYSGRNKANIRIDVKIDGKGIHAQFVELKSAQWMQRDYLPFEIAPKKITAYSDPDVVYGKSTATLRQGPMQMLDQLAKLSPGKHTVELSVYYYGKSWAKGSFDIQGSDFAAYKDMAAEAAQSAASAVTLPKAGMSNKAMEDKMRQLARDAGWPEIYRLNIIDKDWWIDRVSGGNSPVKSRRMDAAIMAEDGQGYYYKVCTFQQPRLITGGWGPLELKHTGDRVPVLEANRDK